MRKWIVGVLCLGVLAPAAAASAQEVDEYLQVLTVRVKPSGIGEYEDYVKKIVAGLGKTGSPQLVFGYQPIQGAPGYTYDFVFPFSKWGQLDGFPAIPQILAKAYGDVPGAAILKSGRAAVEGSQTVVYRLLRNLSSTSVPPHGFVQVIQTEVEPSAAQAYELYLARLKSALDQAPGGPPTLRYVSVLGTSSTYMTAQFFNKQADRDSWPVVGEALRKVYGEADTRQLLENGQRIVRHRTYQVDVYRPDLSRAPAQ
jgi:hypothetical protein